MKHVSGLTTQQIAELSRVPIGTVSRILTGHTDNPTFVTVAALVKAMGGSLDVLAEITKAEDNSEAFEAARAETEKAQAAAAEAVAAEEQLRQIIVEKNRWLGRVFVYACVVTALLVFLLLTVLIVGHADP